MYKLTLKVFAGKSTQSVLLRPLWPKGPVAIRPVSSPSCKLQQNYITISKFSSTPYLAIGLSQSLRFFKQPLAITQQLKHYCSKVPETPKNGKTDKVAEAAQTVNITNKTIEATEATEAAETAQAEEQPIVQTACGPLDGLTEEQLQEHLDELKRQIDRVRKEHNTLLSKYENDLKTMQINCLKMTQKVVQTRSFSIQAMAKDLLVVEETLRGALDAVPRFMINDTRPDLEFIYNRLARINDDLLMTFKTHGIHKLNPIGEQFDPQYHEVVYRKPTKDAIPNAIVEVVAPGFRLWERCLKPAKVGVAAYVLRKDVNVDEVENKNEKVE